jgi:hypothetical protein
MMSMIVIYIQCLKCGDITALSSNGSVIEFLNKHALCGQGYFTLTVDGFGQETDFDLMIDSKFWKELDENDKMAISISTSKDIQKYVMKNFLDNIPLN